MNPIELVPRRLEPFLRKSSARHGVTVDGVVLHWTAGNGEPDDVARFFASPGREASYHVVIGRDGDALQLVELERAAWHAGDGSLAGARPNPRSIGVSLCNRGPIDPDGDGPIHKAEHWKRGVRSSSWEPYPDAQVVALVRVLAWLRAKVPTLSLITGHEDLTAGKIDPGPALPWDRLPLADLGLSRWLGPFPARWPRP